MRSLYKAVLDNSRSYPDRLALSSEDLTLTNREAISLASAAVDWLLDQGIQSGQLVALSLRPETEWVFLIALDALGAGGAIVRTSSQVNGLAQQGFDALVTSSPDELDIGIKVVRLEKLPHASKKPSSLTRLDVNKKVYRVLFTSGSSGIPKAVSLSSQVFETRVNLARKGWLQGNPFLTLFGLDVSMAQIAMASAIHSNETYLMPGSPDFAVSQINNWKISTLKGSESQFDQLLSSGKNLTHSPERIVITGSYPSARIRSALFREFPASEQWLLYGSTEAGQTFFQKLTNDSRALGKAAPGIEVRILPETGSPEGSGLLAISSPGLAKGYLGDFQATSEHFRAEGFVSGDLVMKDAGGNFSLLGRVDNLINLRGGKLNPEVLEEHLEAALAGLVVIAKQLGDGLEVAYWSLVEVDEEALYGSIANFFGAPIQTALIRIPEPPLTTSGKKRR